MAETDNADWAAERGRIIEAQERARADAVAVETAKAKAIIAEFLPRFSERGIEPTRLRALSYSGRTVLKTHLVGWYLLANRTVGIDTDGNYYVLRAQGTLRERLTGADVQPIDPPLVVGRGGKDGESFDLPQLLAKRLDDPIR